MADYRILDDGSDVQRPCEARLSLRFLCVHCADFDGVGVAYIRYLLPTSDKSLQSAGAAGIWRADGVGLPYMNIFASTWALTVGGLVCALPMVYLRVKNTTDLEDETL